LHRSQSSSQLKAWLWAPHVEPQPLVVESQNVAIEYRSAEGGQLLPALAAELVRLRPDLIVTTGTPCGQASTSTIHQSSWRITASVHFRRSVEMKYGKPNTRTPEKDAKFLDYLTDARVGTGPPHQAQRSDRSKSVKDVRAVWVLKRFLEHVCAECDGAALDDVVASAAAPTAAAWLTAGMLRPPPI
jgi:hypothetical protein